jgi:hypothetical protein
LKALKKDLVNNLKVNCKTCRNLIEGTFEKVKEFDVVATIKDRLESLALQETLHTEEKRIRLEFKYLFEPIPHVDELPLDFMAKIKLKDPTLKVKNCYDFSSEFVSYFTFTFYFFLF